METRVCQDCEEERPIKNFGRFKSNGNGKYYYKKTCNACEYAKRYGFKTDLDKKAYHAWYTLKNKGVHCTREEILALFKSQGPHCQICGSDYRLAVDHCDDKKEIRGLLCFHCNTGLGHFKHDPELMVKAIEYLQKDLELECLRGARVTRDN